MQLGARVQHLFQHLAHPDSTGAAPRASALAATPAGNQRARVCRRPGNVRAVKVLPAGVLEPGEGELFEVIFSDRHYLYLATFSWQCFLT